MKRQQSYILPAFFTLVFTAGAASVPFNVSSNGYNFPLDGGGGGLQATLNGATVESFCDDFLNEIFVPSNNSANVTQMTSSDLSKTRFGEVTSFTSITLTGGGADQTFLNGASDTAAVRYDMVAFLVSQYNRAGGDSAANNEIQAAIWTLMDPSIYPNPKPLNPDSLDVTSDLKAAADWFQGGGATAAFLSNFEIVSDASMLAGTSASGWVGIGGFQEQIVETPEPRAIAGMLGGLLIIGVMMLRRRQAVKPIA
jgi:hypothetical protein